MWLCIDRIVADRVVMLDDGEGTYTLSVGDYTQLVGRAPKESDILSAHVVDGVVAAATYDPDETARRAAEARAMLDRLLKK